jgi:hypothetical protein
MPKLGLVLIALAGLSGPANAQTQCPELTRLRADAAEASKETRGLPVWGPSKETRGLPLRDRCEAYIRLSIAWNDVAKYAADHREACDVSSSTLDAIESAHRAAVKARDNICSGRPAMSYPAEVILH